MRNQNSRALKVFACFALACVAVIAPASRVGAAKSTLKKSDAQKLVAAYSLLELNKGEVSIKEIAPGDSSATVTAAVHVGVRFERDAKASWRGVEMRVGDREWESLDTLARAFNTDSFARARAALDSLAAELDAQAQEKKRLDVNKKNEKKDEKKDDKRSEGQDVKVAGEQSAKAEQKKKSDQKTSDKDQPELVRGALRVKNPESALSPMGKSAVVEVEIEIAFDVVREGGKWRIASASIGGEKLPDPDAFARTLDAEKSKAARADLEALAVALESFKRERGFYVVSDSEAALVDFLNPRYTPRVIRVDPWHHPYEYTGTRDDFTLRSTGPDGKRDTPDDINLHGHAGQSHSVGE
jgi:hypothetical protein